MLAGGLVLGTVAASLVIVTILGGWYERVGKSKYTAVFDLEEGVPGLKKGAEVRLGGFKVGQVESVAPRAAAEGKPAVMVVKMLIDNRAAPLEKDTKAYLEQGLLGSASNINFKSLGSGGVIDESYEIDGAIAAPAILEAAGYGEKQKTQVQSFLDSADETGQKAKNFLASLQGEVDEFARRREKWYGDADAVTTNARSFMEGIEKERPDVVARIKSAADELKKAFTDLQTVIAENRETAKEGVAEFASASRNFDELGERLKTQTIVMIEQMIDEARAKANGALDTARSLLTKADSAVAENVPQVRATIAKLRLSGDQLASTLAEVRRSPWRLIYRPDQQDLNFELLYDSARVYAQAVSDVGSATDALKGLNDAGALRAGDRSVGELTADLAAAVDRLKEAEGEFIRQLKLNAKK